jgi:hypothetical protein
MQPKRTQALALALLLVAVGGCQPTEPSVESTAASVTIEQVPEGPDRPARREFTIRTASATWHVVSPGSSTSSQSQLWTMASADGTRRKVADWLTAMGEIDTVLISPDGASVATVSVGEGHPVLEVFDLEALAAGQRDPLLCVDPYPGTIHLVKWDRNGLWFQSEMDLTRLNQAGRAVNQDPAEPEGPMASFRWQPGLDGPALRASD